MSQEKQDVLNYLKSTNRPYSANDMLNLNKNYGKTVVQRTLDQLVEEATIKKKVYGKQKVYSALQDQDEDISDMQKELENVDTKVNEKLQHLKSLEQEMKTVEKEYNEIQSILTTEEAEQKLNELQEMVKSLESKLTSLSQNKIEVSATDRDLVKVEHVNMVKEYRKRKRICMDMINAILEGYPKNKKALFEEIGLEPDDLHNAPNVNL